MKNSERVLRLIINRLTSEHERLGNLSPEELSDEIVVHSNNFLTGAPSTVKSYTELKELGYIISEIKELLD